MGRHAVRQAIAQVEGARHTSPVLLEPHLTVRGSSAVAPVA
jgi:DNA-binding LacI/PurR family transcriptional regulator